MPSQTGLVSKRPHRPDGRRYFMLVDSSSATPVPSAVPRSGFTGLSSVTIAGRRLTPTPVFDTYWRFAAERQAVYVARCEGRPVPWTQDPILCAHRFTNCYRAADR